MVDIGLGLNVATASFVVNVLGPQFGMSETLWANIGGIAAAFSITAWNFIVAITTNPQIAEVYLKASGEPPALNSLIAKYKDDPNLGVFVRQALTSFSWPQPDNAAVKAIFSDMISSVLSGQLNSKQALEQAQNQINALR